MKDLDYFIKFYESIPEKNWIMGQYVDPNDPSKCCAYGHLGETDTHRTQDVKDLANIVENKTVDYISHVNDNESGYYTLLGTTPKQRVVNFLKSLR